MLATLILFLVSLLAFAGLAVEGYRWAMEPVNEVLGVVGALSDEDAAEALSELGLPATN